MRIIFWIVLSGVFAFILSCQNNNEPKYPITPYIELRDFKFIKGNASGNPDSLKVAFYLRDGDFDIGVSDTVTQAPFNPFFVFNKKTNQIVPVTKVPSNVSDLVIYPDRRKIDTLPPLSCSRWLYDQPSHDTVYFIANRNYFNLSADLYIQDSTTVWKYQPESLSYPWYISCDYRFDARFPPLNGNSLSYFSPFKFKASSTKEGIMTYTYWNNALYILLHGKEIKLNLWIKDRALHSSNVIETPTILIN